MWIRPRVALDLGTACTRSCGQTEQFSCSSRIVRNTRTGQTVDVGKTATRKTADSDTRTLVQPIQRAVPADYDGMQALMQRATDAVVAWWSLFQPSVLIARSQLASVADIQQIKEAAESAGAYRAATADVAALAALGADTATPDSGLLVVDIGAGTTEAAVVVNNTPVRQSADRIGGQDFVKAVQDYIQTEYNLHPSVDESESVLTTIGSALPKDHPDTQEVAVAGGSADVSTNDVAAAIQEPLETITAVIRDLLQKTPATLLADIARNQIMLTGGVAHLPEIDTFLSRRLSVTVNVADMPQTAVIRGGRHALNYLSEYNTNAAS